MTNKPPSVACLALGSNIGNAKAHFDAALVKLQAAGNVVAKSSLYRCKAAGNAPQADYWNAVILFETSLSPLDLLNLTQDIESACGRTSKGTLAPRTLDIDIVFYDDLILDEPELKVPHPRAHERDFVLLPIREITPSWKHPVLQQTVQQLIDTLEETCLLGISEIW